MPGLIVVALYAAKGVVLESRAVLAAERHKKGYNCAQAVACTYCDLVGVSEEEAFRSTEAFGLGMGGMLGT